MAVPPSFFFLRCARPCCLGFLGMDFSHVPTLALAGSKLPIDAAARHTRPRSKIARRKHVPLLQFDFPDVSFLAGDEDPSPLSFFQSGITTDSSLGISGSLLRKRPRGRGQSSPARKEAIGYSGISGEISRPVTRWYSRQQKRLRNEQLKQIPDKPLVSEIIAVSAVSQSSEVFPYENNSKGAVISTFAEDKALEVSDASCLESVAGTSVGRIAATEISEASSAVHSKSSDLACSERFSEGGTPEYSSCEEMTVFDFQSHLFRLSSEGDLSSCCASSLFDSGDEFSERSSDEESTRSQAFSLFVQLTAEFISFETNPLSPTDQEPSSMEFVLLSFGDHDDEESYRILRERERKMAPLRGFAADKYCTAGTSDMIVQQRLVMVKWIVQRTKEMELHNETLFLAVNLMDRFLGEGYFSSETNLQLLGIACAALATRLEENQPYNNVRQKSFIVEGNEYTRTEVVAMEWLVMDVLKFQCYSLTVHNFLWFYLKAARADAEMESLARYLAVLSLLDHNLSRFFPSTTAAGLVILAALATDNDFASERVMETHVRTKNDDLPECIQSLEWLVKFAC